MDRVDVPSTATVNARGIPRAPFIDDATIAATVDVEQPLAGMQEMLSKYRFMESNTSQKQLSLEGKIPELAKTLETLELLQASTDIDTTFELSDTLYAHASVPATSKVMLWLGANVMLEYTTDEAQRLIEDKLRSAERSLAEAREDLDWLRDQTTVTEVNIARLHNHGVLLKRQKA